MKRIGLMLMTVCYMMLFGCASGGGIGDNVLNFGFSDVFGLLFVGSDDEDKPNQSGKVVDFPKAVNDGKLKLVKKYVSEGVDINKPYSRENYKAPPSDTTALVESVKFNYYEVSEVLLKNGANPNVTYEMNPIMYAIWNGNYDLVKLLLEYRADPNSSGVANISPLMQAVKSRNYDIAKLLLQSGANPSYTTENGQSALRIAQDNHDESFKTLIENAIQGQ